MRILMTADTVGGVWTYALDLAAALRPRAEVWLATMGPPPDDAQRAEASRAGVTLRTSTYRLEWMDEPWADVEAAGDWLMALEREAKPDVVHLNGYAHAALPWRAPSIVVAHSCVWSWWQAVHGCEPPGEPWRRYREAVTCGLASASAVVAPTGAMLQALRACYGRPECGQVIYNGRDAARFAPGRKRPRILAAGRVWDEAKNMRALEAVAGRLDWRVSIAGDQRHPATGQMPPLSVDQLGRLSPRQIADELASTSIYVLPARYEPFGLGALEAALAGCALVLGDIASLREVWGDAAVYVDPDDPEALHQTLRQMIHDPTRRRALARQARGRALELTPARMAAAYERLYGQLVGTGNSTALAGG